MVMRPGLQGVVWALPGLILSGWAVLISVAGFATGMPFWLAAEIFGVAIVLSVLWLPVVLYLVGTRLTLDDEGLELRELFGLRVKRLPRAQIRRIERFAGDVPLLDDLGSEQLIGPSIPVAYYDVIGANGRRWTRLRSWVWNRNECERLRNEVSRPA